MMRVRAAVASAVMLLILLTERPAFACPVCFGAADSPLIDGARLGVLVMVGVTVLVLAAFGLWFLKLRRLGYQQAEITASHSRLRQEPS